MAVLNTSLFIVIAKMGAVEQSKLDSNNQMILIWETLEI